MNVAVDWNVTSDQRMLPNAAHVLCDARRLIRDGVPLQETASARTMAMLSRFVHALPSNWRFPGYPPEDCQ